MKAALLYGQEDLRLEEIEMPPLEPFGLRIRILTCGICGSDQRMFFTGPTPRYINPVILGHEIAAVVTEVGKLVKGYSPGDIVTLAPLIPCMICPACSRGYDNLCQRAQVIGCTVHGGMAEYMTIPSQMVLAGGVIHLPGEVDLKAGALTELVGCALHALEGAGGVGPGDRVLIIGDGPIGLTFLQLAKLMGARLRGHQRTAAQAPRTCPSAGRGRGAGCHNRGPEQAIQPVSGQSRCRYLQHRDHGQGGRVGTAWGQPVAL